jgi:alpha-L-rhamnosidase
MVVMDKAVKGDWKAINYDDNAWPGASKIMDGKLKGTAWGIDWALVPSTLPAREMTYQRIAKLRGATGVTVPAAFPGKAAPVTVPAHTLATLLLDQTFETNAYVTLNFSGGKDAGISLGYAESLYQKGSKGVNKGNRNDVEGKEFVGRIDSVIADGSKGQTFTTLNFRTYRYIKVTVQTKDEPLTIDDLYGTFTGYPFKHTAVLNTDNAEIKQMLDIGWRTARLNAWETYWDCPYYEQLQYIGDTRIQAMVSYYNSGDDLLARNAINLMDHSRITEGATQSRWPTRSTQIISTFSLWYIGILHDYWMYRPDSSFLKDKLMGERAVLDFFSKYQGADGSLKNTPYWNFIDWVGGKGWNFAMPPQGSDGNSAILDLQLLMAYQWGAELESNMGMPGYAALYRQKAGQLKQTIQAKYWNTSRKLYADTKEKDVYSQHANALAILAGVVNKRDLPELCKNLLNDKTLTQCTLYFKYYLHQALVKGGFGQRLPQMA